ncbi:EAL domain-containing protein [Oleidesulfovibrio sp.]|uniref:sensor domain-containing diguanylate cyclase n=1 Tax=Oleidesulfovibrio sp. TaxID=2909707 RepID=UPI003A873D7F
MPFGGVSLVDNNRVWLKGRVGVDVAWLEREGAFCSYAVESSEDMFIVPNTLQDERFAGNPLVCSAPDIRFYAAANLIGHRGYNLGTLWVMGQAENELTEDQRNAMRGLAGQVVRLLEMRYQNAVTGLPNRGAFVSNLQCALNQQEGSETCRLASCSRRTAEGKCLSRMQKKNAVIGCIKIHNLHLINTAYGSNTSEELLHKLTARLQEWVGEHNLLAHLENDDIAFALFENTFVADSLLKELVLSLSYPVEVSGSMLHLSTSVGVSHFPDSGRGASALLDQASAAASRAEEIPPATVLTFFDSQAHQIVKHVEFIKQLPEYLRNRNFIPYYQPQVDTSTGRLIGFEALARLRCPKLGLIGPNKFIQPAEQSGLIYEIDILMFDETCRNLRNWMDEGLNVVPVAVNLSRMSVSNPDLLQRLRTSLAYYKVPPELVELEMTESGFSEDPKKVATRIQELHHLGLKVAIDDFGTGVSNLSTIRDIPFERLKADRLYVHGASANLHVGGILRFIKGISDVFNTELLCEGVETTEDLQWITALGCSMFQGWYFSRELPPENVPDLLKSLEEFYAAGNGQVQRHEELARVLQQQVALAYSV